MHCGTEHRIYSLELIKSAVKALAENNKSYYILKSFLPYLIVPQGEFFLPLNRDYKPLGLGGEKWIKYQECSELFFPMKFFKGELSKYPLEPDGAFFFFSDNSTPILTEARKRYIALLNETILDKYNTFILENENNNFLGEMQISLHKKFSEKR